MQYFVITASNAAPFFGDTDEKFIEAANPAEAVRLTRANYKHPAGLYALSVYSDANSYHKRQPPLAQWLSPRARVRDGLPCDKCGKKMHLSVANGGAGYIDIQRCHCGNEREIDMRNPEQYLENPNG